MIVGKMVEGGQDKAEVVVVVVVEAEAVVPGGATGTWSE